MGGGDSIVTARFFAEILFNSEALLWAAFMMLKS